MAHTVRERKKLLDRTRRMRGQVEALERLLEKDGHDCSEVLHLIVAARGAINGLLAQVVEGHIRDHLLNDSKMSAAAKRRDGEELISALNKYIK